MKQASLFAAIIAATSFLSPSQHAQTAEKPAIEFPQPSPAASFKERVGLTPIEIEYSRPSAKGRKIFGGLVPFDQVWRTGANAATKITFGGDVKFGGADVPAGTYALLTIPGEKEWTVILNKVTQQFGAYAYDEKNDLVRVKAKPVALAEPIETFCIGLGNFKSDSAVLSIAWDKTRVPVEIKTDLVKTIVPQIEAAMSGDGEKPYFAAAMFYYEHDLDLALATDWIEAAVMEQPDALWIVYRKGLILAKSGDKAGALAAANESLAMAKKAGGELGAEYTRLNEALIASLK